MECNGQLMEIKKNNNDIKPLPGCGDQQVTWYFWEKPRERSDAGLLQEGDLTGTSTDSPGPIDVLNSFPRVLRRWPRPLLLAGLWAGLVCLGEGAGRGCHLGLHVHGRGGGGVTGLIQWLFLTHHGQRFLLAREKHSAYFIDLFFCLCLFPWA